MIEKLTHICRLNSVNDGRPQLDHRADSDPSVAPRTAVEELLLRQRLAGRRRAPALAQPIRSLPAAEGADSAAPSMPFTQRAPSPLSAEQRRLWFLQQLDPDSPAYNVPAHVRIRGQLDPARLAAAVRAAVTRHDVLRSRYETSADTTYAIGDVPLPRFGLTLVDVSGEPDPEAAARAAAAELERQAFDLAVGPLIRTSLIRLAAADHVLACVVHHSVFDRESLAVWSRELSWGYRAALDACAADPLPVQYDWYAVDQASRLANGDTVRRMEEFWRQTLAGITALVELPLQRQRPDRPTHEGDAVEFEIDVDTLAGLTSLAREHGTTLFVVGVTAFALVLARNTDVHDTAVVGIPVSGRRRRELQSLIGMFTNTVPLRVDLAPDWTVAQLVDRTRAASLAAFDNSDLPFDRIVDVCGARRDPSHNLLCQVWFDTAPPPRPGPDPTVPEFAGARAEHYASGRRRARFDLELHLTDGLPAAGVPGHGTLIYGLDQIERAAVERMARHLTMVLTAFADRPETRLSDVPLLDADEYNLLIERWSRPDPVDR